MIILFSSPPSLYVLFFFNDTATTEIYTLSLHDALPISVHPPRAMGPHPRQPVFDLARAPEAAAAGRLRSEEHTSELQSRLHLVCRLLLEKKKLSRTMHDIRYDAVHDEIFVNNPFAQAML